MNTNLNPDSYNEMAPISEVEWLAFCYLANELEVDERARFEARLAEDFDACEALQAMVDLTSRISNSAPVEVSANKNSTELKDRIRNRRSFSRRVCLAGIFATTAAILLLASLAWLNQIFPRSANEQMAMAWADQVDFDAGEIGSPENSSVLLDNGPAEFADAVTSDQETLDSADENDWLFAALISLDDWPQTLGDGG